MGFLPGGNSSITLTSKSPYIVIAKVRGIGVSVIDELPPGRKPIQTIHKFDTQTTSLYDGIRKQINLGRQVYILFTLIK